MPKTKVSHNLPSWFEEKGYQLSNDHIIYYREFPYRVEVAHWNWTPSLTSVIEAVKEFEKCQQVFKYH